MSNPTLDHTQLKLRATHNYGDLHRRRTDGFAAKLGERHALPRIGSFVIGD
jgi:hypothetical protein